MVRNSPAIQPAGDSVQRLPPVSQHRLPVGDAAGEPLGALIGMGIREEEARYYELGLQQGGILVSVDAGARAVEARNILVSAGAECAPSDASYRAAEKDRERIELREEELRPRRR